MEEREFLVGGKFYRYFEFSLGFNRNQGFNLGERLALIRAFGQS